MADETIPCIGVIVTHDAGKVCTKCKVAKDRSAFSIDRRKSDGLCVRCKACRRNHYLNDREAVLAECREYNVANQDVRRLRCLAYYYANKDARAQKMAEWYLANKDTVAQTVTAYRLSRPGYGASLRAKRRACEIRATPLWANADAIAAIYEAAALISSETGIRHHVDHIVPLQGKNVCGLHCEANLRVIPAKDNISKSNKWPIAA